MATLTPIGQITASAGAHEHSAAEVAAWHPVASRASINPHYTDPSGLGPSRNAIPRVDHRFGRSLSRVIAHGVREIRLEWRAVYTQVADPGEVNGPNAVTIRAAVEYPAGRWRKVNGTTAWSSSTAYAAGDQITHAGQRFVAINATSAGQTPTTDPYGPWRQVQVLPVSWPGQDANRRVTVAPGGTVTSVPIRVGSAGIGLMAGHQIAVCLLASVANAGGAVIAGADALTDDFVLDYPTTPDPAVDLVDAPVTTESSLAVGTPMPIPTLIAGRSEDPSTVAVLGDSLFHGLYDTAIDNDIGGFISRAFRARQHYHVSVSGARTDFYTQPAQVSRWRCELVDRYPVVLTDLGGNDAVVGDGTTNIASNLAMVQQRQTALWRGLAQRSSRVWATTMTPWTASSDGWATTTGQTRANNVMGGTNGLDGVWGRLRDWMIDGAPITVYGRTVRAGDGEHPLAGIVDIAYAVIDPATGWKWKAGLSPDGMHPNATGHQLLATALRPYLPALTHMGGMSRIPSGTFEGHWSVPFAAQAGGGESKAITASADSKVALPNVLVDTLSRTVVDGVGCTMNAGIFEPIVGGEWRFEFATQWMGGSSSIRAMYLCEVASNTFGNLGSQGLVSDAMSSGTVVRLKPRQRMALYVSNWTRGTTVRLWNDGMTHIRATWLGP